MTTMRMSKYVAVIGIVALLGVSNSCKEEFLDVTPNGAIDEAVLANAKGIDGLLIGAYSMLDGTSDQGFGWEAASSNWVYGSIRGMEANKGTDAGDQPDINPIMTFTEASTNPYLNVKWRSIYEGISRANGALRVIDKALASGAIDDTQAESFRGQARALRGIFHFEAYRMWAKNDDSGTGIPFMDKDTDPATVKNDVDVRDKIIEDLQAGIALPENMGQAGRFNKTVCQVLTAKALMQMKGDYTGAKALLQAVVSSGKRPDGGNIGLEPFYGDVFDITKRNGTEAIYTVQYSVNDGSGGWNGGWGEVLNFPYKGGGSPGGCCGFFQPNQEFVNAFRTSGGLPLLDNSYNDDPVVSDQGLGINDPFTEDAGPLDPRLDWTVGRRGIPYLDWGPHTGADWIRDQGYAGPYSPKKQVYRKSQEGQLTEVGNWTSGWTANGYRLIRYADVLLLLAECQIQTGELEAARTNINAVRNRIATRPESWVKEADGITNAATYVINPYNAPFADASAAHRALRMERLLELGMEGHRYFDMQRWHRDVPGYDMIAELNRILTYERPLRPLQFQGASIGAEDVNYPIPQRQLELSDGNLQQNRSGS